MGPTTSKHRDNAWDKVADIEQYLSALTTTSFKMDRGLMKVDESRLLNLMQALQRIARLQREATSAQIEARQKRREATLRRQDVWMWDAKLMAELQRLTAEGKLAGLEELLRIGEQCQDARNDLGPIEQEGIEADQQWEGNIWNLRQAEEHLYKEFAYEFEAAGSYPPAPISVASSEYNTSSEPGNQPLNKELEKNHSVIPYQAGASAASSSSFLERPQVYETNDEPNEGIRQDSILLGVGGPEVEGFAMYSDSGIGDIDKTLGQESSKGLVIPPQSASESQPTVTELYPHLLTDFASKRERINNWLENTVLISRMEATSLFTIVKELLEAENIQMPSNWSQLVVAYWELDAAALPRKRRKHLPPLPCAPRDQKTQAEDHNSQHQR